MSRKKTNKSDYYLFSINISRIADENGGKYAFAEALGVVYDSVRRWCNGENLPDGQQLLSIRDKFGVSIDWLLTGADPTPVKITGVAESASEYNEDSMCGWPQEIKDACRQLKQILLSNHPVIKPALQSNLAAFQYSVEKEKSQDAEIQTLSRRIKYLEDYHTAERDSGIDGAASSSTGKQKT